MLFIDGRWQEPESTGRILVHDPATEEVAGEVPDSAPADVDRAVTAARAAFDGWAATPLPTRLEYVRKLRDAIRDRAGELAAIVTTEMGAPVKFAATTQVGLPVATLTGLLDALAGVDAYETVGHSRVYREPAGVVGAITPWNYPLHQAVAKIGPALAAGCTVVHKPSEVAPLSANALAGILAEIELPPGVYNLVHGLGAHAGAAIAAHPGVDMVSFTGSTAAGRKVSAAAAETVKRVALELGGKSANVILADADLATAVKVGVGACFINSGQTCTALTRMLVHRSRYDEAVERAVAAAAKYTVGAPDDPATRLGPLVSAAQRDRVRSYVERGRREGAKEVFGGGRVPERGYFVAPYVFADVDPGSTIAQEEIFGPVLSVIPFDGDDDAVRIANGTPYGLAGAVWSADVEHALAIARRLRTGQVDVNGARFNPAAPFGGFKQSGTGRELGRAGYEEFTELKAVQL